MITIGDIRAMASVVDDLTAEIESLDAAQAIGFSDELVGIKAKIDLAISLLKTRTLNVMDGQPIKVGSTVYIAKPSGKWRPDWRTVRVRVVRASMVDENGEMQDATEAVGRAVDIMHDLYVSPASVPKKGAMDRLGVDLSDVATYERGVPELKKLEVGEAPD